MNNWIRVFIAAFLMISMNAVELQAQNTADKAKTILESVSKKMNGMKSLKAAFTLKLKAAGGQQQTKKGNFAMKGSKFNVSMGDQEIFCDNQTIWTYLKSANEVQVNSYNASEQTISPAKLFSSDFYDKEYTYTYSGSRTFQGKACDAIELKPKGKGAAFSKIELLVDKNSMIAGGNIFEKNGNQITYEISNIVANPSIPDSDFTFDVKKHPGVEVVDLR